MGESYWVKEIKLWMLHHAVKHDMKDVVKYILKDKATTEHLYQKFVGSDAQIEESSHPTYLFLLLLEHLKESLQNFQPPDNTNDFSWDRKVLSLIIDILDGTYKRNHFVDFLTFIKLLKLLQLMVVFRMIYENPDSHSVCGALNLHFPLCNSRTKDNLIQAYGRESEAYEDNIRETYSETRSFILKILLNARWKKVYLVTNYGTDVQKMVQQALPLLDVVINAVKNFIGPSTIEQVISCASWDIFPSNDPAVQIILEYLKPDMIEDDFLELLKILEFPEYQDDNLNISFGFDKILTFFKVDDCPNQEERQLKFSVIDDDTPPTNGDNPDVASVMEQKENDPLRFGPPSAKKSTVDVVSFCATQGKRGLKLDVVDDDTPPSSGDKPDVAPVMEQKEYGPLGLGPPSAKKSTVEEASEVQVIQEHMELVMDSEDEELP